MLDSKNALKEPYDRYERRRIRMLVKEIPEGRKEGLLTDIICLAAVLPKVNYNAYSEAVKQLKEDLNWTT